MDKAPDQVVGVNDDGSLKIASGVETHTYLCCEKRAGHRGRHGWSWHRHPRRRWRATRRARRGEAAVRRRIAEEERQPREGESFGAYVERRGGFAP